MNDNIHDLLGQIAKLESQLQQRLHERKSRVMFQINGKRVEFEKDVREAHGKLRRNFVRWLVTDRPQNLITGPIIYFMVIPMMLLDLICASMRRSMRSRSSKRGSRHRKTPGSRTGNGSPASGP